MRGAALVLAAAAGAALFVAAPARAEPDRAACDAAYQQGQRLRRSKKLLEAQERFLLCARDPCPRVFQPECVRWLDEVSAELPTVIVEVRRRGALVSSVRVLVDGAPFVETMDGVARAIDPGEHEIRVEVEGAEPRARRETVLEGVKAQRFVFEVEPAVAIDSAPRRRGPPSPLVIGLGALGGLALGGFGYFGISGLSQRSEIEKCTPHCLRGDVEAGQRTMLFADISLGVAVVALGGALVGYLLQAPESANASNTASGGDSAVFVW